MANDTTLLVAAVEDEAPFILEWVAHHRLCGFDRIQVHLGDSTDNTVRTLRMLDRIGVIEFHNLRATDGPAHWPAYAQAAQTEAWAASDWCLALDGDEFLNVTAGAHRVQDLIDAAPEADAILVNRRIFGSCGERELPGKLVTERFTRAEPAGAIASCSMSAFRALARTSRTRQPAAHLPEPVEGAALQVCNASGLPDGQFERDETHAFDPGGRAHAAIHHYPLRGLPAFLLQHARAAQTGQVSGLDAWRALDRNEEDELSLAASAFDVWAEMKRLDELAEGKLLRVRQRGLKQWRMALDALLERGDIRALRDAILAETAPPLSAPFKLPGGAAPVFRSSRAKAEEKPAPLVLRA